MDLTMNKIKTTNFRIFLQEELLERCRKNSRYSLRAFAKSLNIVPSALSDMINGKRSITVNSIEKLGLAIGLSLSEINQFISSKQNDSPSNLNSKEKFQQITLDMFAFISNWYHYAILELMKVQGFKSSPTWISKTLGITPSEAKAAIERLQRLCLLEISIDGTWKDTSDGFSTNIEAGLTSSASKKLQKQILQQAIQAIDEVPLAKRDNTSMTMAIDPRDLPLAIEKIKNFRRGLCSLLEKNKKPKEVYHLAISLFPISQVQNLKEN